MGLFSAKYCSICNNKIGMLGNRKLDDGNMCKDCASLLSPWLSDRRQQTVEGIREHLAYREANKQRLAGMNVTRTLGGRTRVYLDEDNAQFVVSSDSRWRDNNADVFDFSQVTGCDTDIREVRNEITYEGSDGFSKSYDPPRYDIDYEFHTTIHVNSRWFNALKFQVNDGQIEERDSVEYREAERQAATIREALTQVREGVREAIAAAGAPKQSVQCHSCGASTLPDKSGRCEYCGAALQA